MSFNLKNMVSTDAKRIRSGERVILRRWLWKHGWHVSYQAEQDVDYLMDEVRKYGGDPEKLRLKGQKMIVEMICKERGF